MATKAVKQFILDAAATLAKRTDTEVDDAAVELVREVIMDEALAK